MIQTYLRSAARNTDRSRVNIPHLILEKTERKLWEGTAVDGGNAGARKREWKNACG
jgi:hypothetical protein